MFNLFKKKPAPSAQRPTKMDPSTIVPRIKHLNFLRALEEMKVPQADVPYTELLVADLLITYAFDMPGTFMMVATRQVEELALSPEELRRVAIQNLQRQIPQIGLREGTARTKGLLQVVTGNNCEACSLLANSFWNGLVEEIGRITVAVPHRDMVLIRGEKTGGSMEVMEALATEAYQQGDRHALTRKLLTWEGGGWRELPG